MKSELHRKRDRLASEFARAQYDLGGLAYEMAIRDHIRVDVLVAEAARLQEIDAELGEVERLSRLEDGAAGRVVRRLRRASRAGIVLLLEVRHTTDDRNDAGLRWWLSR